MAFESAGDVLSWIIPIMVSITLPLILFWMNRKSKTVDDARSNIIRFEQMSEKVNTNQKTIARNTNDINKLKSDLRLLDMRMHILDKQESSLSGDNGENGGQK